MKTILKKSPLVWTAVLLLTLTPVAFDFSTGTLHSSAVYAQGGNGGGGNGGGGNGGGGNGGGGNGGGGNGGGGNGGGGSGNCDGTGVGNGECWDRTGDWYAVTNHDTNPESESKSKSTGRLHCSWPSRPDSGSNSRSNPDSGPNHP